MPKTYSTSQGYRSPEFNRMLDNAKVGDFIEIITNNQDGYEKFIISKDEDGKNVAKYHSNLYTMDDVDVGNKRPKPKYSVDSDSEDDEDENDEDDEPSNKRHRYGGSRTYKKKVSLKKRKHKTNNRKKKVSKKAKKTIRKSRRSRK